VTAAIVVDASTIAAVIFNEPEQEDVLKHLVKKALHAAISMRCGLPFTR
jgi:hypothetical protein